MMNMTRKLQLVDDSQTFVASYELETNSHKGKLVNFTVCRKAAKLLKIDWLMLNQALLE